MDNLKCHACGLVNFATIDACRRCDAPLFRPTPAAPAAADARSRSVGQLLLFALGTTVAILVAAYLSLLLTSEGLSGDEEKMVADAVAVLERANFSKEVRGLRHFARLRRSDNWWNRYVGHPAAYAATNFPFGVVTLYPAFFAFPVDDTERASILLHESHHLFGEGEDVALRYVWIEKARLGWTPARYRHTRVWRNTLEWTAGEVPDLFTCGADGQADCLD